MTQLSQILIAKNGRADWLTFTGNGGSAGEGDLVWIDGLPYIGSPGATVTGLPGLLPHPDMLTLLKHYGAATTGDATVQIEAALDSDLANIVSDRVYSTGTVLTPAAGKRIDGRGQGGITRLAQSGTGPYYAIKPTTGQTFKDAALDVQPMPASTNGASWLDLTGEVSGLLMDGVTVDMGITVDPGTGARNANAFLALFSDTSDIDGMNIRSSAFSRSFWGFVQNNATVASLKNVSISDSSFDDFGSTYLLFNSPAVGSINENILIAFNRLGAVLSRQPFGGGAPGFPHRGSFAGHVHYARVIGNHAHGYGGEFFRAEEDAKGIVFLGNTAKLDGKDGVEFIANNVTGTVYTPTLFAFGDNVIENVGLASAPTLGWGLGLHVYTAVAGLENAECIGESTFHDTILKGWAQGLQVHQGGQRNLIHHMVIADNEEGLKTWAPSLGMDDLLISDCDTAIRFERGGVLGKVHFRSADAVPDPQEIVVTAGAGGVTGWTFETARHSIASGNSEIEIAPMGQRIDADLLISLSHDDGSTYGYETGRITYDGTTLIYTRRQRVTAGSLVTRNTEPVGVKNGNLAIGVFNGAGVSLTSCRVQVALTGLHTWS